MRLQNTSPSSPLARFETLSKFVMPAKAGIQAESVMKKGEWLYSS